MNEQIFSVLVLLSFLSNPIAAVKRSAKVSKSASQIVTTAANDVRKAQRHALAELRQFLPLSANPQDAEIQRAFRQFALKHHPDRNAAALALFQRVAALKDVALTPTPLSLRLKRLPAPEKKSALRTAQSSRDASRKVGFNFTQPQERLWGSYPVANRFNARKFQPLHRRYQNYSRRKADSFQYPDDEDLLVDFIVDKRLDEHCQEKDPNYDVCRDADLLEQSLFDDAEDAKWLHLCENGAAGDSD